jgi:hypothetical protein
VDSTIAKMLTWFATSSSSCKIQIERLLIEINEKYRVRTTAGENIRFRGVCDATEFVVDDTARVGNSKVADQRQIIFVNDFQRIVLENLSVLKRKKNEDRSLGTGFYSNKKKI